MMTSSTGDIFRFTGHLCEEFIGPGEFPPQRPVTRSFDFLFWSASVSVWLNGWVNNREAGDLKRFRASVMNIQTQGLAGVGVPLTTNHMYTANSKNV